MLTTRHKLLTFCLSVFLIMGNAAFTQTSYSLVILQVDSSKNVKKISNLGSVKTTFRSELTRNKAVSKLITNLRSKGFLTVSIDRQTKDSLNLALYIFLGKQYRWANLSRGNVDDKLLNNTGYRDKLYLNQPFNQRQFARFMNQVITYCENHGYPFASVKLDSVKIDGSSISAKLKLTKNTPYNIDSIRIIGSAKTAPAYIYNYLGIKPGSLYNEDAIGKISARIKELPFVVEKRPAEVIFMKKRAKLRLFIDKKKANNFNGVIGVLPDQNTGNVLVTGDIRLTLKNALARGELIDLNWKKLQDKTQDLHIQLNYPFLFNTPFGIDFDFKLYQRDTLFTNININVGVQYFLKGGNYLKAFIDNRISNLVSTKGLETAAQLENADVNTTLYGLAFKTEKLDYRINPRKGIDLTASASIGTKSIRENEALKESNTALYDSINVPTVQANLQARVRYFIPLFKRFTIMLEAQGGYLLGKKYYENELFRIGGLNTLRGFDEESIFTSSYTILTTEIRFLLEQNSYFHVFWNGAYYENQAVGKSIFDAPQGFGTGVSFETKIGIFQVSWALGKQFNNPIDITGSKLHFGFTNYF